MTRRSRLVPRAGEDRAGRIRSALRGLLVVPIAVAIVAVCVSAVGAAPADEPSVLILLPGPPGLPAAAAIATGIRAALLSAWSFRITIETEHVVDLDNPEAAHHLRELYRSKYGARSLDLVIAAVNPALELALARRRDLWPGVPIIACCVDERTLSGHQLPPATTVLTIRYDFEGTLRAALALLPATQRVALVGGTGTGDQEFHRLARQAVQAVGERLELIDLTTEPIDSLMRRVTDLPEHTVMLGSVLITDADGRSLLAADLVPPLSAVSNRPLFTVFGPTLGRGVVGGSMVDFAALGREAGALAVRALRGDRLPDGPVATTVSSTPRFDGRQLRRWRLDEQRAPPGSEIVHAESTLWQQFRWHIIATVFLLVLQGSLIVGLLVQRRERRRTQTRLVDRLRLEHLIEEVSATLTGLPLALLHDHVRDCLRRVVILLGVDRAALWRLSPDRHTLTRTHFWAAEGIQPPPPTVAVPGSHVAALVMSGQRLSYTRPVDLPPTAGTERQLLEQIGVKAWAAFPLQIGDRLLGALSIVCLRAERTWPDEDMQQLQTLAELFATALIRDETQSALESSEAFAGAVLSILPGETAIIDAEGVIVQTNEAWARLARTVAGEVSIAVGDNYLAACRNAAVVPADSARKAVDLIEAVLAGRQAEGALEYPSPRAGAADRWYEMRVRRVRRRGGGAAIMRFDITARKAGEALSRRHLSELAHMDRVAAMGELASSIAHELKQPLTAILTNAQAAQRLLAATPVDVAELQACLLDIADDDRRAGEILRRMRRLLKKTDLEIAPVDLNTVVADAVALVSNDAFLHGVALAFTPARVPVVYADAVNIEQVVLNLLTNAVNAAATGSTAPGGVVVWTETEDDGSVEVGVRDSGKGIAEGDLVRIFEPFYTTRPDGLGMGLTISRSIVEAHGGRITAENDPAGGAIFRVHLLTRPDPAA